MIKLTKQRWVIMMAIWSLVAVFTSTQLYLKTLSAGGNTPWFKLFYIQLLVWNAWGALSPLIFLLGRKYRVDRQFWWRGVLIHLPIAITMVVTYLAFYSLVWNVLGQGVISADGFINYFKIFFLNLFHWHFFIYVSMVGGVHALLYYQEAKAHELESISLERALALNQLNTLKIQLQPHFLFNTLNNVVSSIRQGKDETATNMLTGLGDLLRTTLVDSKEQFCTLRKEVGFIRSYLDIEKERFKDLQVHYDIGESTQDLTVPNFILQPVVENAIKHGISRKTNATRIEISSNLLEQQLLITVYNEGPSLGEITDGAGFGMGISNTKERLDSLYHGQASLELLSTNDGVVCEIKIPLNLGSI